MSGRFCHSSAVSITRSVMLELSLIHIFDKGNVYSEYAMIPFDMECVKVQTKECKVIEGYEELKEWWENEE